MARRRSLVVLAFGLLYLAAAPRRWTTRTWHLAVATVVRVTGLRGAGAWVRAAATQVVALMLSAG